MDQYRTVKNEAEDEFVERRSRFIGRVKPVKTEEDAVSFIRACKSKYWDASHNVYAYSLREGSVRRYSDDGEPQGTAGVPVLEVLQKSGVTDLVVVVTRYFGGVVTDTQFTDVVEISFQIPGESLPALNRKLADATSGSVQAQAAGELFVEWKD